MADDAQSAVKWQSAENSLRISEFRIYLPAARQVSTFVFRSFAELKLTPDCQSTLIRDRRGLTGILEFIFLKFVIF